MSQPGASIVPSNEEQKKHWDQIVEISRVSAVALDKSDTGQGKSFSAMNLAKVMDANAVVIAPSGLISKWIGLLVRYNVPYLYVVSYETVRPLKNKGERILTVSKWDAEGKLVEMQASGAFKAAIMDLNAYGREKRPLLLVVDEYQNAKNADTANHILVKGLIKEIRNAIKSPEAAAGMFKPPRVIMLSATPYDKESHAAGFLKMIGAFNTDRLWTTGIGGEILDTTGWQQLLAYARTLATHPVLGKRVREEDRKWVLGLPSSPADLNAQQIAYAISSRVVEPALSSAMLSVDHKVTYNLFKKVVNDQDMKERGAEYVTIGAQAKAKIDEDLQKISSLVNFTREEDVKLEKGMLPALQKAFQRLEIDKSWLFQGAAHKILNAVPSSKVIIMLNFIDAIDDIAFWLKYRSGILRPEQVAIIKGSVPSEERDRIVAQFQEPNLNLRVIVANIKVIKEGRDLHDTDGRFPRYMLISPSYSMIPMVQASGRIDRIGLKSTPHVRYVYTHTAFPEIRVIQAIIKKGKVLGIHRGLLDPEEEKGAGVKSSRKKADIASLSESTGEDEDTTAEPGTRSNPLPGDFMCMVEDYVDPDGKPYLLTVDQAREYLLKYYGVTPEQALGAAGQKQQAGVLDVGVTSGRAKPRGSSRKPKVSVAPDPGLRPPSVAVQVPGAVGPPTSGFTYVPPVAVVPPPASIQVPGLMPQQPAPSFIPTGPPQQTPAPAVSFVPTGPPQQTPAPAVSFIPATPPPQISQPVAVQPPSLPPVSQLLQAPSGIFIQPLTTTSLPAGVSSDRSQVPPQLSLSESTAYNL